MAWLAPWVAAAFALFGAACLALSAFLGVIAVSDEVLDAAQVLVHHRGGDLLELHRARPAPRIHADAIDIQLNSTASAGLAA
jgi:hypothetical protein